MTKQNAPIAIFAYNRKDNLEGMLRSLQACHGFKESPVILFIDGPKNEKDLPKVEEVRAFVRSLEWPNLEVVIREKNMGLKQSIYTGVSDICNRYGRVIVLEDDLLLSPIALDYFNEGLTKYENEPRIWSIVGYQYDVPELRGHDMALVLPFTHSWGWATWKRAWERFDIEQNIDVALFKSKSFSWAFNACGVSDFTNMCKLAVEGRINSWYVRWNFTVFCNHGLSIFPPSSYVENIGLRSGGTHATWLNPYRLLVGRVKPDDKAISLPDDLVVDYQALDLIRDAWDTRIQRMICDLGRYKRRIKYFVSLVGKS